MQAIAAIVRLVFWLWYAAVAVRVLLSWFDLSPYSRGARYVVAVTEPVLKPTRRALAPLQGDSGLDFSPVVVIILSWIVEHVLLRILL